MKRVWLIGAAVCWTTLIAALMLAPGASDDTLLCAEPTTSGPVIASMPECAPVPGSGTRNVESLAIVWVSGLIAGGAFWVIVRREI